MSKTFCNLPWTQLYVATSGHQRICCMNNENIEKLDGYRQYNMREDQILDSWNSDYLKKMRLALIKGERVRTCSRCYLQEDLGYSSMRSENNKEKLIASTNSDGSIDYFPSSLELHFGNLCNLNCKMCSQQFSHSLGKELLKMGEADPEFLQWVKKESGVVNNWTGELDIVYDWFKNEKIKKSIFSFVSEHVEDLNIIGGEPTVIKEFYELLEYCYNQKTLGNKKVLIHSNMTNTNPNLTKWLGEMKHWAIAASIDGIDLRNRYIRYPANWKSIVKNLEFYKDIIKLHGNGSITFGPAIQLLNIDQLVDLCEFFQNTYLESGIGFYSHVKYPIICDYDILPSEYKKEVAEDLENNLYKIKVKRYVEDIKTHINGLRKETFSEEQKKSYQAMFIKYNDYQDKFRSNTPTWRELLPKLEHTLIKNGHK
jgi:MoaA/NifB/PqqE/SkfB family radical SAM enzyme